MVPIALYCHVGSADLELLDLQPQTQSSPGSVQHPVSQQWDGEKLQRGRLLGTEEADLGL